MEKCFYVESKQYDKSNLGKAVKFALNLLKEDSTIGRIVVLVSTRVQYQLIQPPFTDKMIKQGYISSEEALIKFDTIKTYSPNFGNKRDIVVIAGVTTAEIQRFEDMHGIKYFIYVPWNMEECISWLRAHTATEIISQKVLEPQTCIQSNIKKAIDWLKNTSYPNEGFHHPLDEDRLKSLSNVLQELDITIEPESIIKYCHENGIQYEAAYKIIEFFQKAKTTHFRTRNDYTADFFKQQWLDE